MLMTIEGREVYVVKFDEMPELPITWETEEEKPYALALARAIHIGAITEPGRYGIEIHRHSSAELDFGWDIYTILEEE